MILKRKLSLFCLLIIFSITGCNGEKTKVCKLDEQKSCACLGSYPDGNQICKVYESGWDHCFCPSVNGTYNVYRNSDVINIQNMTEINGNLEIHEDEYLSSDFPDSIDLPNLQYITGNLSVIGTRTLNRLSLPALQSVGDIFIEYNEGLQDIIFPVLKVIGKQFKCTTNKMLNVLTFPSLDSIGNKLTIDYNDVLTNINFPLLTKIGGTLAINDNYMPGLCHSNQ